MAAAFGRRGTYRALVLVQPMPSLTDLALGLVTVYLVWRLRRGGEAVTHWRAAFGVGGGDRAGRLSTTASWSGFRG